jgi:multiple sugar transport system substrate-binding protein
MPTLPDFSKLRPQQMAILLIGGLAVVIVLFSFYYFSRRGTSLPPASITVWGTDDEQVFQNVTGGYKAIRPNVTVTYKKIDAATYDRDLLDALAAGDGPDVFMIDAHDLGGNLAKVVPAPAATMDTVRLRALFPKAAEQDLVVGGQVYALPLYMDTLALFYNKDLLDSGGVVNPPKTWDELQQDVQALRSVNDQNQVTRAAVALGGSDASIAQSADILSLLMIQNGTQLADASSTFVNFGSTGEQAFNFYLQFANPLSPYYTWSDTFGDAVQRFAKGDVAMMLGYSSTLDAIKRQNPFIDVRVAPAPQASGTNTVRTYPDYQVLVVSKQSKEAAWAWDFIANVTANAGIMQTYGTATGRPPALNSLIAKAGNDDAGLFARQSLVARSWYQVDGTSVAALLNRAIVSASSGTVTPENALRAAGDQISALFRRGE